MHVEVKKYKVIAKYINSFKNKGLVKDARCQVDSFYNKS